MLQWYHLHMGLKVGPNNGWGWSDPALLTSCFVLGLCKFDGSYAAWVWPQKMANLPIVVQRVSHFCLLKPAERLGFRAAKAKKANRQSWPEWRQNSRFQSQTMFILKVRVKHQYLKYWEISIGWNHIGWAHACMNLPGTRHPISFLQWFGGHIRRDLKAVLRLSFRF